MAKHLWEDRENRTYDYPFLPRPECLALIQREPTVALDIGCGSGGVGYALRQRFPECALWGCELDPTAAGLAREHFDRVLEQDIETVDFESMGLKQPFDLVCMFDVLEHLVNPWQLLRGLQRIVAQDAHLLVSLPNVANIFLMHDALSGHWRYTKWGLLDFTHLRFFADFDARKMFYQTGYRVLEHRVHFAGLGGELYKRQEGKSFPFSMTVGDITIKVHSQADFARLCADQNLYLLSPHHGRFMNEEEQSLASDGYPATLAFGG